MTNKIDTSPARLRELADAASPGMPMPTAKQFRDLLLALADEKEAIGKALHYPDCWDTAAYPTVVEALQEVVHSVKCSDPSHENEALPLKCRTCGSDCNERDMLEKAEREIDRLRAEKEAAPLPAHEYYVSGPMFADGAMAVCELATGRILHKFWIKNPAGKQEPVGTLSVSIFRGHLENVSFVYSGNLRDGVYPLYLAPQPSEPVPVLPGGETEKVLVDLVDVLQAYEGGAPTIANQGQSLDGYSALANFVDIAQRAREALRRLKPAPEPTFEITVRDNQHPQGIPYEQWAKPKPAPVRLTSDERNAVYETWMGKPDTTFTDLMKAIEAAVLEKNRILK